MIKKYWLNLQSKLLPGLRAPLTPLALPIGLALLTTLALYVIKGPAAEESDLALEKEEFLLDSLVPEGQALVPIQVSNMEALEKVVGLYGVVDLYALSGENQSVKKVGGSLKIVRDPHQPDHVNVLVSQWEAIELLSEQGPFRVVVLNPNQAQDKPTVYTKPKSRIRYFDQE